MDTTQTLNPSRPFYQRPEFQENPYLVLGLQDSASCVVAGLAPTYEAAKVLFRTVYEVYPHGAAIHHLGRTIHCERKG